MRHRRHRWHYLHHREPAGHQNPHLFQVPQNTHVCGSGWPSDGGYRSRSVRGALFCHYLDKER